MLTIIQEVFILKIQQAINSSLNDLKGLNSDVDSKLKQLQGKSIGVSIKAFPFDLNYQLLFNNHAVNIVVNSNQNSDLQIKLTPGSIVRAKLLGFDRVLRSRDIELTGDLSLAMELQSIMNNLDVNVHDILQAKVATVTSDQFAWQLRNIINKVLERFNIKNLELQEQIAEYLHTEKKITVSKTELEYFYQDVDELQNDLARLSSRITKITQNLI